jgi:Rps23 Pro-64 3,4-dihydroxylase Tpa1-like proline 4-hydroxylase
MAGRRSDGDASPGLREVLDQGMLRDAAKRLERHLRTRPKDAEALRALGDLQRQQGHLDAAAATYKRLLALEPGDAVTARLVGLLGEGRTVSAPALPTRFLRLPDFLPDERLGELREHVRTKRSAFKDTAVKRAGGEEDELDHSTRRSSSLLDLGDVGAWFNAMVEARIPEFVERLGMEPFEAGIHSCKISAYHDGHFFHLHQDRSTGVAATRVLGFLFYFDFPPRRFHGGELLVYDRDPDTLMPVPVFTTLPPEGNSLVVVPANCWHEVLPIVCKSEDWFAARFTYSGWIHDEVLMAGLEG